MAQDIKIFRLGGQNLDDAIEFISKEDWIDAYNVRVVGSTDGEAGNIANIESTTLIPGTRSSGINKGIGGAGFEVTRTAYFFIFNSQQLHIIGKLDYDTNTQSLLFVNKTDSGGDNILTLNPSFYINDAKLLNDIYLSWTDGNMQPCLINLERLEAGGYGTLTLEDLLIIKAQVLLPPTAVYGDDAGQSVNLLQGKLFQFRVQLEYQDYYRSAGSTWSKRPVPISEATPAVGTDVTKNNNIVVSVDIGTDRVQQVNVWAHFDNLDWFTIKSASRAYILALPTTLDIPQEVYEAYDPGTNLYSIAFYNDGLYENVDVTTSDLDYDHVPLKAETLEAVNGNILALGGITEGYERPEVSVRMSVTTYNPPINLTPLPAALSVVSTTQYRITGSHKRQVFVYFDGTAHTGDIISIKVQDIRDYSSVVEYTYTVPAGQDGNTQAALLSTAALIPGASFNPGDTAIVFVTASYFQLLSAIVTPLNASSELIKSIPALKSNSSYQAALAHFDGWGRYFPIVTSEEYVMNTPSYAQSQGQSPQINWEILSTPPAGAVSAQWLLTLNNTHQTDLFVDGVLNVAASDQAPGYFVFDINPLKRFNQVNSSSVLTYEFSEGDRCTFAFYYSSGTTPVWFNNPAVDVEVGGFEITSLLNYQLKVRKPSSVNAVDITNKNILLELYTLRLRTIGDGDTPAPQLFYEIGEEIPIVNGAYTRTSGTITDGDVYFKIRQYVGGVDPNQLYNFAVEDFNYSDFYPSMFTSYGRARFYLDEPGNIERKAVIRHSDVALRGTLINGLNRFFPDAIYGETPGETSANYGWLRKIAQRGSILIGIQEIEVPYIPINTTIVEDQQGSDQYALSSKLFNNCRYSGLGFGIGNAKTSYVRYYNNLYFFDPNKSLPVRAGLDGIQDISGKLSQFFKRTGQAAYSAGKKLIGYYDIYNNEYLIATETDGDIVTEIPFTPTNWQFENQYAVAPGDITLTAQGTKTVTTYNNTTGIATVTGDPGETGADAFSFQFNPGSGVIVINACGTITAGSDAVNDFAFTPLIDKELSTLYVSNSILVFGNTIAAAISISAGGGYSVNGGAYTSIAGTVVSGDTVTVRQTSSGSLNTLTTVTLTIDGQSAPFNVTTKNVASNAVELQASAELEDVCLAPYYIFYLTDPLTDIAPGVVVYTDSILTTPATGYSYIIDLAGDIYEINSTTGVVGSLTGGSCGTPSTFRFDQIYNQVGEEVYATRVTFSSPYTQEFVQPQLSDIPIATMVAATFGVIEINIVGTFTSVKLVGAGVSSPSGLCLPWDGGGVGFYDFFDVTIPAGIDFAIIIDNDPC